MNGSGYMIDSLNNIMIYIFWLLVLVFAGAAIYLLIDWEQKHPDGD